MRAHLTRPSAVAVLVLLTAGGCGGAALPPAPTPVPSAPPPTVDARLDLAARAAASGDRTFVARYTLNGQGRPQRTVTVTHAGDRTWRVDVPGGAEGGTADIAIAKVGAGIFTCRLPSPARPGGSTCVRVAEQDRKIPTRLDPQVQHLFSDWAKLLTDQRAPLSVSVSRPLPGAQGTCFAIESTSASISVPLDAGIYCYAEDGLLTAAKVSFGTLTLAGAPGAGPPSVNLPGPVTAGQPLGMASPPPPPPAPSKLPPSAAAG